MLRLPLAVCCGLGPRVRPQGEPAAQALPDGDQVPDVLVGLAPGVAPEPGRREVVACNVEKYQGPMNRKWGIAPRRKRAAAKKPQRS